MYFFIRNDCNSFSQHSRIFEVYENDELITCLVFGFDEVLDKYFICQLGDSVLSSKYSKYEQEIDYTKTITAIYQFLNLLPFLDPSDFLICNIDIEFPKLIIDNIVVYVSDVEPYEQEQLLTSYEYSNYLLNNNIVYPIYYENLVDDEYNEYNFYDIKELYKNEEDYDISVYCTINYDKLKTYCESI